MTKGTLKHRFTSAVVLCACTMLAACSGDSAPTTHSQGGSQGSSSSSIETNAAENPNILLIMVDDLGFNDLAINNLSGSGDTPNLDAFAQKGIRFTRHYASPVCSPARAALLTGQHPERFGFSPNGRGIPTDVVTLPDRLIEEGYTTWHLGKWHLGDTEKEAWPDRQGFQHWLGFLNQWRLAGKTRDGEIRLAKPRYKNPWLQGDTEPGRHFNGHLEDILTEKAIEVISDLKAAGQPWFLNLWYYAPHTPISPSAEFADRYPKTDAGRYRALLNQLDSNIGRVLGHLEAEGLKEETVVIVVSDNGGTNRQIDNNAPYFGSKSTLYEGGIRTPLLIRWPNQDGNAHIRDEIVTTADIYPTLMDALGFDGPAELDGVSFYQRPSRSKGTAGRTLFWEHGNGYSVLSSDGRWRLYHTKSIFGEPQKTLLYDLLADPTGTEPVSSQDHPQTAALSQAYDQWYRDVHTIAVQRNKGEAGSITLSGMDLQRAPGFSGFTFALGLSPHSEGTLASQEDIWRLERSGDTITAHFGEQTLSGEVNQAAECSSVIVSGFFYRHISSIAGPDTISLSLYVDGKLAQTGQSDGVLSTDNLSAGTVIGDPNSPTLEVKNPRILNVAASESSRISIAELHRDACADTVDADF
ncbi:MAG: sulfatase-like hydrolase/transferase [Halioglobus sp.]